MSMVEAQSNYLSQAYDGMENRADGSESMAGIAPESPKSVTKLRKSKSVKGGTCIS